MKPFRRRYLKIRISGPALSEPEAKKLLMDTVLQFLGEEKTARARVQLMRWDSPVAALRCAHDSVDGVVAALALKRMDRNGGPVLLRVEKTSGTLLALTGTKRPKP